MLALEITEGTAVGNDQPGPDVFTPDSAALNFAFMRVYAPHRTGNILSGAKLTHFGVSLHGRTSG